MEEDLRLSAPSGSAREAGPWRSRAERGSARTVASWTRGKGAEGVPLQQLLHAMSRMQAWRDEEMRQGAPAVVDTSPTSARAAVPSAVTLPLGRGAQRFESMTEFSWSPYSRLRMIEAAQVYVW